MKLNGLLDLYKDMKLKDIERYRFEYQHGRTTFDIFFFIDEQPFVLLFGAKQSNFSFEIEVLPGFEISCILDKGDYRELCRILELVYNPQNKFSTKGFFESFNENIPSKANPKNIPKPHQVALYRKDIEDANKIFFIGWRDNDLKGEHVTDENLKKTKVLMGMNAYKVCKKKNISSCWTDIVGRSKEFHLPR